MSHTAKNRSSHRIYSEKFRKIHKKKTCARVTGLRTVNFIEKETLAQVFPCEFCKISKNNFLQNTSGQLLLKKIIRSDYFPPQHPMMMILGT